VGLRRPGRGWSGLQLQGGSLLEGEPQLIRPEGTGIEFKQLHDGGIASSLARVFGYSHRCWRTSADHPTGRCHDPPRPAARRPGARRGLQPQGGKPPAAPRPGPPARPTTCRVRKHLAHWRTTVRCTPVAYAPAGWENPAASSRLCFPRRGSLAARVVDRCHLSRV
jgi:hypothetical protein